MGVDEYWFELGCDLDHRMIGDVPTSVTFDCYHDAVIVGWYDGMISTYSLSTLSTAYSSFKAHPGAVSQMTSLGPSGILSVSSQHVCIHGFGGANFVSSGLFSGKKTSDKDDEESKELTSTLVLDPTRFVVGCKTSSNGNSLYELDLNRLAQGGRGNRYLHKFRGGTYDHGVRLLCPTTFGSIICGGDDGKFGLLDLRNGHRTSLPVLAHSGGLTDMDVYDNLLVTCGLISDGVSNDPFAKLFDLRMHNRPLGVLQTQSKFVRFLPGYEARAMFTGEMGNISTYCDLNLGTSAKVEQIDQISSGGGTITGMCLSVVGRAASFVDSAGHIHLWSDDKEWVETDKLNVNPYPQPMEEHPMNSFNASEKRMSELEYWSEPIREIVDKACYIQFENENSGDTVSLSTEERNAMEENLSSNLSKTMIYRKTIHEQNLHDIHPSLLEKAQTRRDFVGQYIETRPEEFVMNRALIFGKETSRKAFLFPTTDDNNNDDDNDNNNEYDNVSPMGSPRKMMNSSRHANNFEHAKELLLQEIPKMYVKPRQTAGKFVGFADFDYGEFNETPFAGLDGSFPNNFANPVLQVLYFQHEIRGCLENYVSSDPSCLATEGGFLFHMLDQAQHVESKNKICEARNFLRTFRLSNDAMALGLLEPTQLETDRRAGAVIRFFLEHFGRNEKTIKQKLASICGVTMQRKEKWLYDGADETIHSHVSLVIDMVYPNELSKAIATDTKVPELTFCDLLKLTLMQSKKTKLWSKDYNEQVPVVQTKTVTDLSDILIINCASHDNRSIYLPLYREKIIKDGSHPYVCKSFKVKFLKKGGVEITDYSNVENDTEEEQDTIIYDVCAVVSHIYPSDHLVAHVQIPNTYASRANEIIKEKSSSGSSVEGGEWLMFNDFVVDKVKDEKEVLDFKSTWRNPCIFVYRARDTSTRTKKLDGKTSSSSSNKNNNNFNAEFGSIEEVFHAPSLALNHQRSNESFVELDVSELPSEGDCVAIDCEMVALSTEESYINSDGRKVVTQQSQMSLARVSCTMEDETVFIDDYIVTPDPIVDYLTRFSGLVPGDLDPQSSTHHLVPLRTAYLKLYHLVDRGCIFVGHGLAEDFKVVNIFVPPEQIIDTVHLFHMPGSRFLSLSFLASYLLGLDIQHKTHDSIEDARTALKLYKEYLKFKEQNILNEKLIEIYQEGRKRNFR